VLHTGLQLHKTNKDLSVLDLVLQDCSCNACGLESCIAMQTCAGMRLLHLCPPPLSPAVDADVCGQLPLLGGQLAAETWWCWLLWQALHIDLLVLTLDLWVGRYRGFGVGASRGG
jgi:hypothetical protein